MGMSPLTFRILPVRAGTIIVPDDYPQIQQAIDEATPGQTILVRPGSYNESLVINKTISLIGEEKATTIISQDYASESIRIYADNVELRGFSIEFSVEPPALPHAIILLNSASNCRILDNDFRGPASLGMYIVNGSGNRIVGNTVAENWESLHPWVGIDMVNSTGNIITENSVLADQYSLWMRSSNLNHVFHNTFMVTWTPSPAMALSRSNSNVIEGNSLYDWSFGGSSVVELWGSSWNAFFHNNVNAYFGAEMSIDTNSVNNTWDDGYPSGGNYWTTYGGTDLYSGPYQNITGNDGIGDAPVVFDEENRDMYPLMKSWSPRIRNLNTSLYYATIQDAIDDPETLDGHAISVSSGTYYEHVVVSKSISLIGECQETTIIDGGEMFTPIVQITANNVTIKCFTIQNSGLIFGWEGGGIYVTDSSWNYITENTINNTQYGVNLRDSRENTITGNTIMKNDVGIHFWDNSNGSIIYHNNFIENGWQVRYLVGPSSCVWDNGCEGNYWSNYNGTDLEGNGIGDTELPWEDVDSYPLMNVYWNPADVDHDLDADLYDAVKLLIAYGSKLGNENFNPHCDIAELYGEIDLYDAVLVLVNYGKKYGS